MFFVLGSSLSGNIYWQTLKKRITWIEALIYVSKKKAELYFDCLFMSVHLKEAHEKLFQLRWNLMDLNVNFWDRGQLFTVTKCYQWTILYLFK